MSGKGARCDDGPTSMPMACLRLDSVSRAKRVHAESLMSSVVVAECVSGSVVAVAAFSLGVAAVGNCPAVPRYRSWAGPVYWEVSTGVSPDREKFSVVVVALVPVHPDVQSRCNASGRCQPASRAEQE